MSLGLAKDMLIANCCQLLLALASAAAADCYFH